MEYSPSNLEQKLSAFSEPWSPKIIAKMNDYHLKLVKFQGEFIWHRHSETDEVFLVLNGKMTIHFRDGSVPVGLVEIFIIPKGKEHQTAAYRECQARLIEPGGTRNTGDVEESMTGTTGEWI